MPNVPIRHRRKGGVLCRCRHLGLFFSHLLSLPTINTIPPEWVDYVQTLDTPYAITTSAEDSMNCRELPLSLLAVFIMSQHNMPEPRLPAWRVHAA